KSCRAKRYQHVGLRGRKIESRARPDAVCKERQRALRGNSGIELAYGASGGIAWIDEDLLAGFSLALVQALEGIPAHVDFPANFEQRRNDALQTQRDLPDGAYVV